MRVFGNDSIRKKIKGSKHCVIVRGGALGDCILTLPLIHELANSFKVSVLTREAYFPILKGLSKNVSLISLDSAEAATLFTSNPSVEWGDIFRGSWVYNFLPDPNGRFSKNLLKMGVQQHILLESRPNQHPHFIEQVFAKAELSCPRDIIKTSLLSHLRNESGNHAWIHPGSGSRKKNTPLFRMREIYEFRKEKLPILASFGEADLDLEDTFREVFDGTDFKIRKYETTLKLIQDLANKAKWFLGNDSGPGHLAASLGVPTQIVFQTTDPKIWKPIGVDVTTC